MKRYLIDHVVLFALNFRILGRKKPTPNYQDAVIYTINHYLRPAKPRSLRGSSRLVVSRSENNPPIHFTCAGGICFVCAIQHHTGASCVLRTASSKGKETITQVDHLSNGGSLVPSWSHTHSAQWPYLSLKGLGVMHLHLVRYHAGRSFLHQHLCFRVYPHSCTHAYRVSNAREASDAS